MVESGDMKRFEPWARWVLGAFVAAHGAVHFLGFVRAFDLAEVSQLEAPIPAGAGVMWLVVGLLFVGTALAVVWRRRDWWPAGFTAVALSQGLIIAAWGDAGFGTVANVVVLAAAVQNLGAEGPWSLRTAYRRAVGGRSLGDADSGILADADLQRLPEPVQRYVRTSGAIGRPKVRSFRATWRGRIRGGPDDPWMEFTAEQHNFIDEPARFFLMDARRSGLPIDVLHSFRPGGATMEGRVLGLVPVVEASGRELDRAETVTVLNDLCIMAPGALIDSRIRWEPIDERSARAVFTIGENTVGAILVFNESGELVDFVSDDRLALSADGSQFEPMRWSTPLRDYRRLGRQWIWARGEGRWHPAGGAFTYLEGELTDVEMNPGG